MTDATSNQAWTFCQIVKIGRLTKLEVMECRADGSYLLRHCPTARYYTFSPDRGLEMFQ